MRSEASWAAALIVVALLLVSCADHRPAEVTAEVAVETGISAGTASSQPPAGLAAESVPMFVVFGFDDNGISGREGSGTRGGLRFVLDLFADKVNPPGRGDRGTFDGMPARATFYVTSSYAESARMDSPEHVKREWRRAADAGHEIGLHTHRHEHGSDFTIAQWSTEIQDCADWLAKPFAAERTADPTTGIGVPRRAQLGFRAPFLEYGPPLFAALRAHGVQYDCSVEEGFEPRFDGRNLRWPYQIPPGYGGDSGGTGKAELWELPVYTLLVPPDEECERYGVPRGLRYRLHRKRPYFDPDAGKITGFDWNLWFEFGMTGPEVVATFRYTLDQRLLGNRAPLTFGAHSDIYSEQYDAVGAASAEERRRALAAILDDTLRRREVRVATGSQLLGWLRAPVPLCRDDC